MFKTLIINEIIIKNQPNVIFIRKNFHLNINKNITLHPNDTFDFHMDHKQNMFYAYCYCTAV